MKNLSLLFIIALFITVQTSCKEDESSDACDGLLESGGEIVIDGETLSLSIAQLLTSSGLVGVVYQFQVGGISNDCAGSKILSFVIETQENSELNGTYPIQDFFDAGLGDAYGVNLVSQTFSPVSQNLTEINSGTIDITKNGTNDYTVDLQGTLITGGSIDINFRKVF